MLTHTLTVFCSIAELLSVGRRVAREEGIKSTTRHPDWNPVNDGEIFELLSSV